MNLSTLIISLSFSAFKFLNTDNLFFTFDGSNFANVLKSTLTLFDVFLMFVAVQHTLIDKVFILFSSLTDFYFSTLAIKLLTKPRVFKFYKIGL